MSPKESQPTGKVLNRREFIKLIGIGTLSVLLDGCNVQKTPEVARPTPTPEASFSIEKVDFFLEPNIHEEDGKKLKDLFLKVYPILKELYGYDPSPKQRFERVKVNITVYGFSNSYLTGFDENGQKTMHLFEPDNSITAIHELSHLFNDLSCEPACDFFREGAAIANEIIAGEELGLLNYYDDFLWQHFGEILNPEPFLGQNLFSYDLETNSPLFTLRRAAAGLCWLEMYRQDPEIFKKFFGPIQKELQTDKVIKINLMKYLKDSFKDDFEEIEASHHILHQPQPKEKTIFFPVPNIPLEEGIKATGVALYLFEMSPCGGTEYPQVSKELNVFYQVSENLEFRNEKTRTRKTEEKCITDENGIIKLLQFIPNKEFQGKRDFFKDKNSKLTVEIIDPATGKDLGTLALKIPFPNNNFIIEAGFC